MLLHSPKAMVHGSSTGANVKKVPTPEEEEAERGAYRDEEGCLYLPSSAFRASLLHGAVGRRFGKISAKTGLAGAVFNVDKRTRLVHPETGEGLRDYKVHVARAVVNKRGVLRARPELELWACVLGLEIDLELLPAGPYQVEEILNVAGKMSGVGDWRPQKTGPHGRYRATLLGSGIWDWPVGGEELDR